MMININKLKLNKSLGNDGFTTEFYKNVINQLSERLQELSRPKSNANILV